MVTNPNSSFAKTICSICYEDLKPIIEDLQSISICGHVFHELCLQQWFEYCSNEKKRSCPVCKQNCSAQNAGRLYFQSVGDQTEPFGDRKAGECEEDPKLLSGEVKRLEGKLSGLNTILERQVKEMNHLNEELYLCKDELKKEFELRTHAMEQKTSIQHLLRSKSEELDALKLERIRLQDRNMALAKELVALKLVSDVNLEEDEVLKLASFGNETSNKDTVDILRKSLVIRNKTYKELMAKCNQLGQGEARSCKRLEKAKEKINKLKVSIQGSNELEMAAEVKDNESLRALKASKKANCKGLVAEDIKGNSNALSTSTSSACQREQQCASVDLTGRSTSDRENFSFMGDKGANSSKECTRITAPNKQENAYCASNEPALHLPTAVYVILDSDSKHQTIVGESALAKSEAVSDIHSEAKVHKTVNPSGAFGIRNAINNGDLCFSSGLMGPDGTNRYLGRWCKRGQSKGSMAMQGTSSSSGNLIAVGSDGRGGRVKVLRSINQSFLDGKENSVSAKKCKYGTKTSSLQSQGCLQIEHFFGRASQ
ncbi:RING ZINC FINGER PROTEIN-RELATED [Salix viminalis]|uniref:RING ZINC FINGER PROTEIN-RELATED n=1 Tax=Salix viminalis TaxID=40686 RepID=A0A9Q0NSX2_SALVM|nr:RING ZINC FINGER PROTEIN-RELATED [Salix viminalis]